MDSIQDENKDIMENKGAAGDSSVIDTGRGSLLNPEPIDAEQYLRTAMASFGFQSEYQNIEEKARLSVLIKACAVFSPCTYNLPLVGKNIRIPTFVSCGENGITEGSRVIDASALRELMAARKINHCIRIYNGRKEDFVQDAVVGVMGDIVDDTYDIDDQKCSQEALAIASIWLELFSRDMLEDPTDGIFRNSENGNKNEECNEDKDTEDNLEASSDFAMVSPEDLRSSRASAVAKHVHNDPAFFDENPQQAAK